MCGIAGYIDMENGIDINLLKTMANLVRHRGPDDEGYVLIRHGGATHYHGNDSPHAVKESLPSLEHDENDDSVLGFGHRRLSVIDVSEAGHQPMEKYNKIIIFNGMIYNYIELQNELIGLGYTFSSRCDTEVILAAYDHWGETCVVHFNGMWAFAIYDMVKKTVFLSRDRFGVKPLYYHIAGNKFLLSSEIKQILADPSVLRKANEEIIAHHLLYEFREYDEQTFFQDIYQLRGGYNALLRLDFNNNCIANFKIWQYYSVFDIIESDERPAPSASETHDPSTRIGEELTRAVQWRLRSDVKLGSCLSGGLDSSSIVAIACEQRRVQGLDIAEFETISSTYTDCPELDETRYSHAVTEYCDCGEHLVNTNVRDLRRDLETICWHQDEPPATFLENQWRVYEKAASLGCKVLLDGQGGDETLGGYNQYYGNHLYQTLKKRGLFPYIRELRQCVKHSSMTTGQAIAYTLYFNLKALRIAKLTFTRKRYIASFLLEKKREKAIRHLLQVDSGSKLQKLDISAISLPAILHYVDRNSMAHSLEVRLPFLDYQYVSSALSIPLMDKIKYGYTKYPLREFINEKLPEDVVWRKDKLGFPVPVEKWIYELDQVFVLDLLDNARSHRFFRIETLKKDYRKKKVDIRMFSRFLLTEIWMRVYNINE